MQEEEVLWYDVRMMWGKEETDTETHTETEKEMDEKEKKKHQASKTMERISGIASLPTSRNALMHVPHIGKIRYRTKPHLASTKYGSVCF